MRPAETSHAWNDALTAEASRLAPALAGVELIEAQHRQEEAAVIALILRNALETPGRNASLVTPDRSLARRVKAELMRWNIAIDDSGGEPLVRFGGAALLHVLADAAARGFDAGSLSGLMRHALCRLGRAPDEARHLASIVELAALRSEPALRSLAELPARVAEAQPDGRPGQHLHPALARLPPADWEQAIAYAADLAEALSALPVATGAGFGAHVDALVKTCETIAGEDLRAGRCRCGAGRCHRVLRAPRPPGCATATSPAPPPSSAICCAARRSGRAIRAPRGSPSWASSKRASCSPTWWCSPA